MNLVKAKALMHQNCQQQPQCHKCSKDSKKYVVGFAEDDKTFQPNATLEVHIRSGLRVKRPNILPQVSKAGQQF